MCRSNLPKRANLTFRRKSRVLDGIASAKSAFRNRTISRQGKPPPGKLPALRDGLTFAIKTEKYAPGLPLAFTIDILVGCEIEGIFQPDG
jgi:hypothetical protein